MKDGEVGFPVGIAVGETLGLSEGRVEGLNEGPEVIGCGDGENPVGLEHRFDPGAGCWHCG